METQTLDILQTVALCISAAALTVIAVAMGLLARRMMALVTPFDLITHIDETPDDEGAVDEPPSGRRSRRRR